MRNSCPLSINLQPALSAGNLLSRLGVHLALRFGNARKEVCDGPSDTREEFHGCEIRIYAETYGIIRHQNSHKTTTMTIRSYPDGIKVGCTFLTSEALRKLHEWHSCYLGQQGPKTHQSGQEWES